MKSGNYDETNQWMISLQLLKVNLKRSHQNYGWIKTGRHEKIITETGYDKGPEDEYVFISKGRKTQEIRMSKIFSIGADNPNKQLIINYLVAVTGFEPVSEP